MVLEAIRSPVLRLYPPLLYTLSSDPGRKLSQRFCLPSRYCRITDADRPNRLSGRFRRSTVRSARQRCLASCGESRQRCPENPETLRIAQTSASHLQFCRTEPWHLQFAHHLAQHLQSSLPSWQPSHDIPVRGSTDSRSTPFSVL